MLRLETRSSLGWFDGRRDATVEAVTQVSDEFPMAFGRSRKYIICVVWKALALHSGFGYRMLTASLNKGALTWTVGGFIPTFITVVFFHGFQLAVRSPRTYGKIQTSFQIQYKGNYIPNSCIRCNLLVTLLLQLEFI